MAAAEKERNSRLELLRILCILVIILRHYSTLAWWGEPGTVFTAANWSWQLLFLQIIRSGGSAANNIFLMISGYYMIGRQLNWKRIVLLIAELFFYSWVILLVMLCTKAVPVSLTGAVEALLPLWFGYNWFVCCYVIFCCFLPFVNPILARASKEAYGGFLLVAFLLISVVPTFAGKSYLGNQFSVDYFLFMFAVGGYIRRFGLTEKKLPWRSLFFISLFLLLASIVGMSVAGALLKVDMLVMHATYFDAANSVLSVLGTFFLFLWAVSEEPFYNRTINTVSKSVIGIFILHYNLLMQELIWNKISPNFNYLHSNWLPLHCLVKVSAVFLCCLVLDQLRIRTVEKCFKRVLDRRWEPMGEKLKAAREKLINRLPFTI